MCATRRADSYRDFVLDQLRLLDGVTCRAMFGGYGLYLGGNFFGILEGGRLFFKTDQSTRANYLERGMGPFVAGKKQVLKSYYEVPEEIVEDEEELASWAREAAASRGTAKAGSRRKL